MAVFLEKQLLFGLLTYQFQTCQLSSTIFEKFKIVIVVILAVIYSHLKTGGCLVSGVGLIYCCSWLFVGNFPQHGLSDFASTFGVAGQQIGDNRLRCPEIRGQQPGNCLR